ncbi:MAG: hypothetical protein WB867_03825 [Candidatus Dormiibacterota bacterium]
MLIFALSALVLFVLMGLAVDAGISYLHSDQQEKAAAAAALSGVGYLPGNVTDAQDEAILTAQRNGYVDGGSGTAKVTVAVSEPTASQLEVSITAPAPVYFLDLLGFGQHEVTASAVAEYLPPIQLGQPGNQLGYTMSELGTAGEYVLRTEGWGNPRHEGDAFTTSPDDVEDTCGPTLASCVASPVDVHQISCIDGDDLCDDDANGSSNTDCGTANNLCLNDVGGSNFLIDVPAGVSASISVYNPSFDPGDDTDCPDAPAPTASCLDTYHEDDGSFPVPDSYPAAEADPATDYDAMAFTLFAVPDVNNRSNDIPLEQDIFCPFNAYDLDTGVDDFSYFQEGTYASACNPAHSSQTATLKSVTGSTPCVYNAPPAGAAADGTDYDPVASSYCDGVSLTGWVPLTSYAPTGVNADLFDQTYNVLSSETTYTTQVGSSYDLYGGSSGQYFRLRVDTLAWNGAVISNSDSTDDPDTNSAGPSPDGYPYGHNAYSVAATTPSGGTGSCSTTCTVSGMGDMTIYTPIHGSVTPAFALPLFSLPAQYAGKLITVRVFNPGVTGDGNAYLGILQPAYTPVSGPASPLDWATVAATTGDEPAITDLGTSILTAGTTTIPVNAGPNPAGYAATYCAPPNATLVCSATVQTGTTADIPGTDENYSGDSIYRGNWLQFDIAVPANYNPTTTAGTYWDLYYQVASDAFAGNTISVQVLYLGSPVHLLPNP